MNAASRKLTLADVLDAREYERERPQLRAAVMALKQRRRVMIGTIVSVAFENRETMRHQVHEMARVEHLITDEAIQAELDAYNPMVPEVGQLCATVFIELTTDEQLREWLPRLVGIERSITFRLPSGASVRCITDEQHASQLTREHVTAAVHYIRFEFADDEIAEFLGAGDGAGVVLGVDLDAYREETELLPETIAELATDLA